jgi:DNA mismatch endonuclease (patch repair protein)
MALIKSTGSHAERAVRSAAHTAGFRFRLHRKDLPGSPDLVFPKHRKVIFVHGCFWHSHHCARGARVPKSNRDYWIQKLGRNKKRDVAQRRALAKAGWAVLTIWECQTRDTAKLTAAIKQFLIRPVSVKR